MRIKVHSRIGESAAARPVLVGLVRHVHACIKTARFGGQVGRGYNCARRVRACLIQPDPALKCPLSRVSRPVTGPPRSGAGANLTPASSRPTPS